MADAARPGDEPAQPREAFARRWAAAIAPGTPPDDPLEHVLAGLVDDLRAAVRPDGSAERARHVGRSLVEHDLVTPEALERTLAFVGEHLATDAPPRLMSALGALAAGFTEALCRRTLDEQQHNHELSTTRSTESAVRAGEAKFRAVFQTSALAIAVSGIDGVILDCNDAMLAMLDRTAEELVGSVGRDLVHPDERDRISRVARQLHAGREHVRVETRLVRADGELVNVLIALALLRDDDGEPEFYVTMIESLDEVRALQSQLVRQSLHDVQTGLPNRAQFVGWLESAVGTRGPTTLALVVFDLDGFRVVNDAYGHDVGNDILTAVAGHLRSVFDGVGQLARIGPDEFGVLIRDPLDVATVVALAESAVELFAEPVWVGDDGVGVTASVGIVVRPARGADAAELLRCVDLTVRWAKDDGKAQWALYDATRDQRERARMRLAASIAGGLEQGEFRVDYEPVHALADGSLLAVEARLRWDHPTEGVLDPQELVSLSTCTGMAARLGKWAIAQACADAGEWHAEFGDAAPVLSMDLTARQCQEPELVATVRGALRESGLPARLLQFELSEQLPALINDDQVDELTYLAEHGVRLVLDQVGGGNVPVDRLRRLPLTAVKFQGSPVYGLAEGASRLEESAAVALLTWSRTVGLPMFAAGVRTEFEARRLAELGVTGAQGPLFGSALLTADEVRGILGKS
ncbi:PAS domain S-box-containing protein/diguanylate cyclase (GGDEF)-like protein [Saccharothrix saharensis]|uniref:PAS domain S-box-containing protein/diguanylate cyclase (GGDEF)-like protein n=1 Tax=Saccharothrix saharensis TaxID=571190 RepID=A0A543JJJ1_9PSEU|nr:EAL domain-containing protein [Saccharothrix saharensis]TQM82931.1 PAS domain S-box-containing protein/diguanylate cyclase (GGDEF)-like protein [Saccharothrix saharensis]